MDKPDIWLLLLLSALATYIWRGAGVYVGSKLDPDGDVFKWLACVAYGMLAGLISRIFIFPVGMLSGTPLFDRLLALSFGFALFFMLKRNVIAGTLCAVTIFLALSVSRNYGLF